MSEWFTFRGVRSELDVAAWVKGEPRLSRFRDRLSERGLGPEKAQDFVERLIAEQLTEAGTGYTRRFQAHMREVVRIRQELAGIYDQVLDLPAGTRNPPLEVSASRLEALYRELDQHLDALSRMEPVDALDATDRTVDAGELMRRIEAAREGKPSRVQPPPAPAEAPPPPESRPPRRPRGGGGRGRGPALPEKLAEFAGQDTAARQAMQRLVTGGHKGLIEDLLETFGEEKNRAEGRRWLMELNKLSDKQLDGLSAIQREMEGAQAGELGPRGGERDLYDIWEWPAADRNHLLDLVGDVKDVVDEGLAAAVLGRGLRPNPQDIQGLLGFFHAARQLKSDFPGARMRFEVPVPHREIDIQLVLPDRTIDVEVKTNLEGEPSINEGQIKRDLIRHAGDRWENLLYRYAPQAGDLNLVRDTMVRTLRDPEVAKALSLAGFPNPGAAEPVLRARFGKNMVDTFSY